jgi:hypothetical protein
MITARERVEKGPLASNSLRTAIAEAGDLASMIVAVILDRMGSLSALTVSPKDVFGRSTRVLAKTTTHVAIQREMTRTTI